MSVLIRPAAESDLIEIADYLDARSAQVAERFQAAAQRTFELLELQPGMGRPHAPPHPNLPGLRVWRIIDFPRYAVYYLPADDGITIVRVLHTSRDRTTIIEEEV